VNATTPAASTRPAAARSRSARRPARACWRSCAAASIASTSTAAQQTSVPHELIRGGDYYDKKEMETDEDPNQ
jgi:hypothetical protein